MQIQNWDNFQLRWLMVTHKKCYCSGVSWTWENRWCRLITVKAIGFFYPNILDTLSYIFAGSSRRIKTSMLMHWQRFSMLSKLRAQWFREWYGRVLIITIKLGPQFLVFSFFLFQCGFCRVPQTELLQIFFMHLLIGNSWILRCGRFFRNYPFWLF